MKSHHGWVALVAMIGSGTTLAADSFQISPLLGHSTLALDAPAVKDGLPREKDSVLAGVQLRFVAPVGAVAEVGYEGQRTAARHWRDDDYLRLTQYRVAVGWQFRTEHGFRITPKVGRARWDLYSSEGLLTQVKLSTNSRRGYDNFWELSLEKTLNDRIALGVLFKDNPYQFGNVKSIAFTASFAL